MWCPPLSTKARNLLESDRTQARCICCFGIQLLWQLTNRTQRELPADDGGLLQELLGPEFGDGGETEASGAAAAAAAPAGPASSSEDRPCGGLSHSGGSLKRRAIFNPGDDDPSTEATTSNPATSTVGERTGCGFVVVRM
jgi:hypothetical protein